MPFPDPYAYLKRKIGITEVIAGIADLRDLITRQTETIIMATQAQTDKLLADVATLIDAGVDEIAAAIAAAQNQSPDPAIDAADARVTTATDNLKAAAAVLRAGQPIPTPVTPTP